MRYKVLDKGFVRLVDFMGGDAAVVRAARVSYGQGSKGEERDRRLIEYLMRHNHGTPFEHAVFTFHVKAPIFVARQWFRHRIGSFNEISGRYTVYDDTEVYLPMHWRVQDKENKQGSVIKEEGDIEQSYLLDTARMMVKDVIRLYKRLVEVGLAKELARVILPLGIYTQFYWTVNARSLMNFLTLRLDPHAQLEMRFYALAVAKIFSEKMPWTSEAFFAIYPDRRVDMIRLQRFHETLFGEMEGNEDEVYHIREEKV